MSLLIKITLILAASINLTLAKDVTMAFGEKIPPFCFPETNSGIEIEIIQSALAFKNHHLIPKYFPFARIPIAFKNGSVSAAMTDLGNDLTKHGAFYGNPAVIYNNVLITLSSKNLKIEKPSDLKGLTILSFQGAEKRYPDWLKNAVTEKRFFSTNDQESQVLTLFKERYDVILMDINIFKYFHNKLKLEPFIAKQEFQVHEFSKINQQDYRPIFKDKLVRDDFNLGLDHIKKNGTYKAIYDKYITDSYQVTARITCL